MISNSSTREWSVPAAVDLTTITTAVAADVLGREVFLSPKP
jgi:hypothetical protein